MKPRRQNTPLDRSCSEFRRLESRRWALKVGMLGGGLSLASLFRSEAEACANEATAKRTKNVIILWMRGGPSQHETWDPKPDAPEEYRGAFGAMSTKVSGIQICDLLPKAS
jgi:hypothetical protein